MEILAQRVRAHVDLLGAARLLKMTGLARSTLYAVLRGESCSAKTLMRLAAVGVDTDGLFTRRNGKRNGKRKAA